VTAQHGFVAFIEEAQVCAQVEKALEPMLARAFDNSAGHQVLSRCARHLTYLCVSVMLGCLPSNILYLAGQDVARLVAEQAAQVYLCAREWKTQQQLDAGRPSLAANVQRRGMITQLTAAGMQSTGSGDQI
jgi:hypothetical protein